MYKKNSILKKKERGGINKKFRSKNFGGKIATFS